MTVDEDALSVDFPRFKKSYPIAELGSVWIDGKATMHRYGSRAENILTGAALGGRDGALAGALSRTGTRSFLTHLYLVICKRGADQICFGSSCTFYPESRLERIRVPADERFRAFIKDVMHTANPIIIAKNTPKT